MAKKAEKVASQAREACEKWRENFQTNINEYHKMHTFVLGRQWDDDEEEVLIKGKKVPLQFNKLATLINSLLGEQQQNTPQLDVIPMDNCDVETANLREIIIKDILFSSNTKTVYQVAASQAAIGGFGAFAVQTEYTHNKSFDLDITYNYFKDATQCYWDVSAEKINKTDGMVCGWLSRMSRKKFSEVYGKGIEDKISRGEGVGAVKEEQDKSFNWSDDDSVTINDYFIRKFKSENIYKLSNGSVYSESEMDEMILKSNKIDSELADVEMEVMDAVAREGNGAVIEDSFEEVSVEADDNVTPMDEEQEMEERPFGVGSMIWDNGREELVEGVRSIKVSKIHHYKIAGDYILEDSEFPSDQMPLVFVDQNSYYDKGGKQICRPFVIDAVDAQRYINYLGTQSAYMLKVSRYDQWIGSKKNVASNDTQQKWKDPLNIQGILTYDESPSGARPEQVRPPELSQSLFTQYQRAMEDLYTSTGLYPTRLGAQGNEVSGAAIDARTRQGSYPTYIFFNNINRAITCGGEIVNEMIPRVLDSQRVLSLMTPDGQKKITINERMDDYGETIQNDLRKGTSQVRLQAGPSYEGQKERALESLQMIIQSRPELFNLLGDLYAENLPLSNTLEIKNRIKTIVPPEIIKAGKTGESPPPAPQKPDPMEQMVQLEAENNQLKAQAKIKELEIKEQEMRFKIENQQFANQMELEHLETERLRLAADLEEQKLKYRAETEKTQSKQEIANADNLVKILTSKIQ